MVISGVVDGQLASQEGSS